MSDKPRYDRQVDSYPCRYVHSSDVVCMTRETTQTTDKTIPIGAVRPRNMVADWAFLTGVCRIDPNHRNARDCGFVDNKLFELIESPGVLSASLCPANRYPFSNSLKFLKGDYRSGVFGFRNNLFRDTMIYITSKTSFPSTDLLKVSFGTFSTTFLKGCLDRVASFLSTVDGFTGEGNAIRIGGEVDNSKIDTKHPYWFDHVRFRHINDHTKIENTVSIDEIDLTPDPIQISGLVMPEDNRNYDPTFKGKDGNSVGTLPGDNALVIDHSTIRSESRFNRFISFVCFNHFGNGSNSHLRRKTISFPYWIIHNFLKVDLVGTTFFKRSGSNIITCFIKFVHGLKENLMLLFSRCSLNHQCLKHHIDIRLQCLNSFWSLVAMCFPHKYTHIWQTNYYYGSLWCAHKYRVQMDYAIIERETSEQKGGV